MDVVNNNNKILLIPFMGLLFLVADEYLGIGYQYIRLLKVLPIPLAISFLCAAYIISKVSFSSLIKYTQVKLYLSFTLMTALALMYGLIQTYAIDPLKQQIGYFMLMVIAIYAINSLKRLYIFSFAFVSFLSISVILNLHLLFAPMRVGFYTGGYFAGDGNDFGWMLNIGFPISIFLLTSTKNKTLKLFVLGMCLLLLFGIIGTQSRGSFLALTTGILYFLVLVSKNRVRNLILFSIISLAAFAILPSSFTSRMETIQNYEEDSSAVGRIIAWTAATNMALDNPFLGVGAGSFNSAYGRSYRKPGDPVRWISTHSIYFKILAEYGFTGLLLYLFIIWTNIKQNRYMSKIMQENPQKFSLPVLWPEHLNMSIIAFFVAGAFLSGVNYPHLYLLTALTLATSILFNKDLEQADIVDTIEKTNR